MNRIDVLSVPVSDQQRAKEFYLKMGLHIVVEAPFQGDQLWIQMGFPKGETSITLVTWFPKMPAGSLQAVVINTDDIAGDVKKLAANGIEVGKIDDTPWGKFASIEDPDGNTWSLNQKNA
ncbi:MAG: VOC family protein [Imperialibacter sp.]|uniref:VOC family protein n=1 Tax=Imperialibacter sp. TaxID=2038411 RepID=UPI0032EB730E